MLKLDLEKAEEPEIKLSTSVGSSKKQENSRKISTSALKEIQLSNDTINICLKKLEGKTNKSKEFQKNICFCFIDYAKDFDCVDHNKLWKILQEMV